MSFAEEAAYPIVDVIVDGEILLDNRGGLEGVVFSSIIFSIAQFPITSASKVLAHSWRLIAPRGGLLFLLCRRLLFKIAEPLFNARQRAEHNARVIR